MKLASGPRSLIVVKKAPEEEVLATRTTKD